MNTARIYITAAVLFTVLGGLILASRRAQPTGKSALLKPGALFRDWTYRTALANRDERGESTITTHLAMIVLSIVLLVGLFAALATVGQQVIAFIQKQLGL